MIICLSEGLQVVFEDIKIQDLLDIGDIGLYREFINSRNENDYLLPRFCIVI